MNPKFASLDAWQKSELLMQPVFIRVIDNLRKEMETSSWAGTYHNTQAWEDEVSEETRALVNALQQELKTASPEAAAAIQRRLEQLPRPHPAYELQLSRGDCQLTFDLWELCYQVCFRNYNPVIQTGAAAPVEVDLSLLDESGEVDWIALDAKAKRVIGQIFANLPIQ